MLRHFFSTFDKVQHLSIKKKKRKDLIGKEFR
jgi:hypothetical protein